MAWALCAVFTLRVDELSRHRPFFFGYGELPIRRQHRQSSLCHGFALAECLSFAGYCPRFEGGIRAASRVLACAGAGAPPGGWASGWSQGRRAGWILTRCARCRNLMRRGAIRRLAPRIPLSQHQGCRCTLAHRSPCRGRAASGARILARCRADAADGQKAFMQEGRVRARLSASAFTYLNRHVKTPGAYVSWHRVGD